MTAREKHFNHILEYVKKTSSVSVDDLVKLAKMDDYEMQHKYLQIKYGQNDNKREN